MHRTLKEVEKNFIPQGDTFDIFYGDISSIWVHCVMLSDNAIKGEEIIAYHLYSPEFIDPEYEGWAIGTIKDAKELLKDYLNYLHKLEEI